MELELKHLITLATTAAEGFRFNQEQGHNLQRLWDIAKTKVRSKPVNVRQPESAFRTIDRIVIAVHEHDSDGQSFRYPTTSSNAVTLPEIRLVNLRQFANAMDEFENALGEICIKVGYLADWKEQENCWR